MRDAHLRLQVASDDDGSAELFADFQVDGFAGQGSAWFNLSEIRDFVAQLCDYPLQGTPALVGGYMSRAGPPRVEQVHLSIRAYEVGSRGQLGVRLRVADPCPPGDREDATRIAEVEILTSYSNLARFANQLALVVGNTATEAILLEERLG
jgi:hypothetical protein